MSTPILPEVATPAYRKEIVYDRESRDYAMYLDGELVGFACTYQEAEATLDQLVFELLSTPEVPVADVVEQYRTEAATSADIAAYVAEWNADAETEHDAILDYADAWNADVRQRVRADVVLLPDELVIINALRAIEGAWMRKVAA